MGVDYYPCDNCGETFPDCGPYIHCEHGHRIGPCCFPKVNGHWSNKWPEDQLLEDSPDYGDCVKESHCPVCAKGGDDKQRLKKAMERADRLEKLLAECRDELTQSDQSERACLCCGVDILNKHVETEHKSYCIVPRIDAELGGGGG